MSDTFNFDKAHSTKLIIQALGIRLERKPGGDNENWKCFCPVHDEKTPSCYIHPAKFMYHCFGCGASGSLASLYKDKLGRSFFKDYGIKFDEFSNYDIKAYNYEDEDYTLPKDVTITITKGELKPIDNEILVTRYLRQRGISLSVAKSMGMMWTKYAEINDIHFFNRLMIPITEGGKILSWEGRDLEVADVKQDKKVLYPKRTTVSTLFDIDNLDRTKPLYVVEGLMDLAVLRSDPRYANSTALFGAGISHRQMYLLRQFDKVIIIPDEDKAGSEALEKLIDQLGKDFYILRIPTMLGPIKDVGDIPKKLQTSITAITDRGWGRSLKLARTNSIVQI
jgi:DNA primase